MSATLTLLIEAATHSLGIPYLYELIESDRVLSANHICDRLELLGKVNLPLVAAMGVLIDVGNK